MGDAGRETGDAGRETGDAGRETGDAGRETGDAGRETGDATMGSRLRGSDASFKVTARNVGHVLAEAFRLTSDIRRLTFLFQFSCKANAS
ncbi:MAG: hypothetical protein C9356_18160 [Oleiphilus sp.]|nr:MAG: hypothetical protein C9356_18160 [Oleiphilus sp.]